ncbi:MAG: Gfo/Idh/MocA family oxidoreductase [Kineosporiaceae bacterium]|nr:Gfo/Idh/MocA family oxidoreductase [Aeromicrobium sp.]
MGAPVRIGLVGASWRGQYFLRVARELPLLFTVVQVLVRSASSVATVTEEWGVRSTTNMADFLAGGPYDFVVVATPRDVGPDLVVRLVTAGIPVLVETPPARDAESLFALYSKVGEAPVQVAEQYQFQPHHAARLAVVRSGLIGAVASARVSVAHGYHGVSLIRLAIGAGFEPVEIRANATPDNVMSSRGRDGWNPKPSEVDSVRTTALLDFGGRHGFFDFSGEQYCSPIRARHISLYGSTGQVEDDAVSYLTDPGRASHETLRRETTGIDGDLEGSFLQRISLGRDIYFENPFVPVRLNDDEIAVAETMSRMAHYVGGGAPFYGLADASQDHYLSLLIDESAASGIPVRSQSTPWMKALSSVTLDV